MREHDFVVCETSYMSHCHNEHWFL